MFNQKHDPKLYLMTPRFIRRRRIRNGLRFMGPERVRAAICTVGDKPGVEYGACFLSHAYPEWNTPRANGKRQAIGMLAETRKDLFAISMAHWTGDPLLMEEVMIYLAEHGTAAEPRIPAEAR